MTWFTGLVVYLLVWILTLFTVLPWGAQPEELPAAGHAPSAPANPRLGRKFLITTLVAAIIWLLVYVLIKAEIVDFNELADQMVREDNLAKGNFE